MLINVVVYSKNTRCTLMTDIVITPIWYFCMHILRDLVLLLSPIDTPVPPSGKADSVLSPVPTKETSSIVPSSMDMRYYNALLREVPQECVSVPVVLHCMVEQVGSICNLE